MDVDLSLPTSSENTNLFMLDDRLGAVSGNLSKECASYFVLQLERAQLFQEIKGYRKVTT